MAQTHQLHPRWNHRRFLALASLPWKLYTTPVVINYFLGGLGALIGPLYGVMVVDYFILRRRRVNIEHLYIADSRSQYFYTRGVNPRAVAAFVPAAVLAVLVAVVPALSSAAPFAWFVGAGAAAGLYYILTRTQRSSAQTVETEASMPSRRRWATRSRPGPDPALPSPRPGTAPFTRARPDRLRSQARQRRP